MKLAYILPLLAAVIATEAHASDARVELRAYVPTSCDMTFSARLEQLGDSSFSIGSISQFCNTNYQLTLHYAGAGAATQFRFGDSVVAAGPASTVLQSNGRPTIATKELVASGVDIAAASALGQSMMLQVTPLAL
jgi:hypothetical protein